MKVVALVLAALVAAAFATVYFEDDFTKDGMPPLHFTIHLLYFGALLD